MNRITEDRWAIADIVNMYNPDGSGDITLPVSQRQWAWKNKAGEKKKKELIDSVMNMYPIPTCILNRTSPRQFEIYDGRHRFATFWLYANDEFEWNDRKYSQLTDDEKNRFNSREIPVTVVSNATTINLAEMFVRLNSGRPLKDYDLIWANKDRPLIQAVYKFVVNNERLSLAFGGYEMKKREDLCNWTALIAGLTTQKAGNMTTSYIRISTDVGLDNIPNEEYISTGINAICTLLETANKRFPTDDADKRKFKTIGKLLAFFVGDWLQSTDKDKTIEKWVNVIEKLRDNNDDMRISLVVQGAQNLTTSKVKQVIKQVDYYLKTGFVLTMQSADSDDDSE